MTENIFTLCRNGDISIIKEWLRDSQNDLIQGDDHGFSPLHWACKSDHLDVVELLLDRGALVNSTNMGDDTPLHLASSQGHLDIVKKLLTCRAEPNAINEHGNTAMHYACFWNYADVAIELLNHGAFLNIENRYGEIAVDKCKSHVAAVLQKRADVLHIDLSKTIPFKDQSWLGTKLRSRDATLSRNQGIDLNQIVFEQSCGSNYYDELLKGHWQNIPIVARILKYPNHLSPFIASNLNSLSPNKQSSTNSNFAYSASLLRQNPAIINRISRSFQEEYPKLRVFSHPNVLPVLGGFYAQMDDAGSDFVRNYYNIKSSNRNNNNTDRSEYETLPPRLFVIVSQCMPLGSLFDVLHFRYQKNNLVDQRDDRIINDLYLKNVKARYTEVTNERILHNIALDVCRGMSYLHSLKPGDISRFHLSSKNIMLDENYRAQINVSDSKFSFQHKYVLYNVNWMSPESLKKKRENINVESSDMWSFATILWEMSTKRIPFDNIQRSNASLGLKIALQNLRLPINEIKCPHMKKLMSIVINENPGKRPTFDMVTPILVKMIEKL